MYEPEEECRALVRRIKAMFEIKGTNANKVAKRAGISKSAMSYTLNGRSRPQIYTLLLICNGLGVSMGDLFDDRIIEELIMSGENMDSEERERLLGILAEEEPPEAAPEVPPEEPPEGEEGLEEEDETGRLQLIEEDEQQLLDGYRGLSKKKKEWMLNYINMLGQS